MSNAFEPEWQGERGGNRVARVAAAVGSQRLGASVVELVPGTLSSPYHFHHANEELLIVLSGTPELRTPDGLRELQPGEVVSFRCGPEGAHRLRNTSQRSMLTRAAPRNGMGVGDGLSVVDRCQASAR